MTTGPTYIHDSDGFSSILQLERSRSDRSGNPFALILFKAAESDQRAGLVQAMKSAVRATDHVGILNDVAAVILWHTSSDGAASFIGKVAEIRNQFDCNHEVFVYPTPTDELFGNRTESDDVPPPRREPITGVDQDFDGSSPIITSEVSELLRAGGSASATVTVQPEAKSNARIEQTADLAESLIQGLMEEPTVSPSINATDMGEFFVKPIPKWKRALDILGSSAGLIVLSPLFAIVAVLIKVTSPGPVIFSQMRSGRGGKPFKMFKFRSMNVDAEVQKAELLKQNEQDGPAFKMERDPRITAIGHLIRKTSIDELPQLLNVLRGDMSIVGPRPLPCDETQACEPWQKRRLEVTPGLTCIWQVQDRRTKIPFAEWARMDIRYIKSRTPKQDLSLVMKTVKSIFGRKGS